MSPQGRPRGELRSAQHDGIPASPAVDEHAFLAAIGQSLGLVLSDAQIAQLRAYLDLLARWNDSFNLTAVRSRDAMLVQHLADCLAVVPALVRQCGGGRVLDVGSGGGLPGVVMAVCSPQIDVTCVDTVGKKAAFVRQVAAELALPNLHAEHARVERLSAAPFEIITSRAFASLADFCGWTRQLLAADGVWMAMKGRLPDEEVAALPADVHVFHVEHLHVPGLEAQRCLVWMRPERAS